MCAHMSVCHWADLSGNRQLSGHHALVRGSAGALEPQIILHRQTRYLGENGFYLLNHFKRLSGHKLNYDFRGSITCSPHVQGSRRSRKGAGALGIPLEGTPEDLKISQEVPPLKGSVNSL